MRQVADLIRGKKVSMALNILKFQPNAGSFRLEKLLLSAISNWQNKNEDRKIEEASLFIKAIFVDSGRMLKRVRPAPQGRAYRVRKRSNHVTLVIADIEKPVKMENKEKEKVSKAEKKPAKKEKAKPKI